MFFLMLLAALAVSAGFGYWGQVRPQTGYLVLKCDEDAPVDIAIQHGRFTEITTMLHMTSPNMPPETVPRLPGYYNYQYSAPIIFKNERFIRAFFVSKSSLIKSMSFSCPGLSKAYVSDLKKSESIPISNGKGQIAWPYETFASVNWNFWFQGYLIFAVMLLFVFIEFKFFLKLENHLDRAIPFIIFLIMASLYVYFFPGVISPLNPSTLLLQNAQKNILIGWEGIVYSSIFTSVLEFAPQIQSAVLIQNLIVFLTISRFVGVGKTTKQRYLFLFSVVGLSFLSPWTHMYTQYLERATFTNYCFCLLLISVFTLLRTDRFYFERTKLRSVILLLSALSLALLRNEFMLVLLPLIILCYRVRYKQLVMPLVFILSSIFANHQLDKLDEYKYNYRFKYYVVSLASYLLKIAHSKDFTADEKVILSRYLDLEVLKSSKNVWLPLKEFEPGTTDDLIVLSRIIFKYIKEDPLPILISRSGYAIIGLGLAPIQPWLYSVPLRKNFRLEESALEAETQGSIKLPGDPFYARSAEIYRDPYQIPPYAFSYGILFIIAGLFLFRTIPVSSILAYTLMAKLAVVVLFAPVQSMHYLIDVYWMCALFPFLAWVEYKDRKLDLSR